MSNSDDTHTLQYFKEATSVILDYTNEEKTDYAILLNGDWGCRKTWFINNILDKALKSTKKKILYISAAGIKDTTELITDIYFAKISSEIGNKYPSGMMKAFSKYIPDAGAIIREKIDSQKIEKIKSIKYYITNDIH